MTTQTVEVITLNFNREEFTNEHKERLKGIVETRLYSKLTDMQKEFISVDNMVDLLKVTVDELEMNYLTDNCDGVDSKYLNLEVLDEGLVKFSKAIKAVKRKSNFSDWLDRPTFFRKDDGVMMTEFLMSRYESRLGNLIDVFELELSDIRSQREKQLVLNYVFGACANCDNRDGFLLPSFEEDVKRMREMVKAVVEVYVKVKNDK